MWVQPMILAPLSGLSFSARLLRAIRPGISKKKKTNETKLTQLKYDKICLLNSFEQSDIASHVCSIMNSKNFVHFVENI